ncbi:alpha-ketoacid dehydrogenase subunit beta [Deinococcus ruber]|uniref:Pyruvate dehydrogenase E1 component subunit beta n=1 Tax=Deinococcus ruber TaxID=1848197 RepID=A0A918F6X1_9DEIO|nr:alpha-ketoacid dehydrogenase subunit beta [Deinococcus ruber]GGR14276.1 pyruvate dehydrogenase E1 component subunit beta [Deinococcus ruber]
MTAAPATRTLTMVQAVQDALAQALEHDDSVMLFGEDVGMGGVFRASDGLRERFGAERVFDTPLSEAGIVGMGIGLALAGMRPVAEIQFAGFLYPALEQMGVQLGRYRHRTQGRFSVPMVIRAPYGGGIHSPELHSESPEGLVAALPGIKVVVPSTPADARGLLLSAIADPDPVMFFESIKLYRSARGEVPTGYAPLPLGQARVVRSGHDCTVLCYGGMVEVCLRAAQAAQGAGIEVEVIDLRTLVPLDLDTIGASVQRTGRVVIVHEAARRMGFGAELSAQIAERWLPSLQAPVLRVAGWDAPYPPFTSAEAAYRPDARRVALAIRRVLEF